MDHRLRADRMEVPELKEILGAGSSLCPEKCQATRLPSLAFNSKLKLPESLLRYLGPEDRPGPSTLGTWPSCSLRVTQHFLY